MRVSSVAVGAALAFAVSSLAGAPAAHADLASGAGSLAVAAGYVVPIGCSAITGAYNGAYLVYGEGAPRRWRTAAYVCGGLSIAIGTYVLVDDGGETTGGTVLGILPIAVGAGAILTAWFVGAPDDIVGEARITPWIGQGSGGLSWSGRF